MNHDEYSIFLPDASIKEEVGPYIAGIPGAGFFAHVKPWDPSFEVLTAHVTPSDPSFDLLFTHEELLSFYYQIVILVQA